MEILRLKLKNDLLELCETYKTTHSITEDTYDDFVKEQIDLLVKDVNFRILMNENVWRVYGIKD
jgi:hypothetical protein